MALTPGCRAARVPLDILGGSRPGVASSSADDYEPLSSICGARPLPQLYLIGSARGPGSLRAIPKRN
jgi:hypothetical protein